MFSIEKATGTVVINNCEITRSLTAAEFIASKIGQKAKKQVDHIAQGIRYHSYQLHRDRADPNASYGVVYFENAKLVSIQLSLPIESDALGWAGNSEENELKRKALHDDLLNEQLGQRHLMNRLFKDFTYTFDWGEVLSYYEARDVSSAIMVRYK